MDHSLNRNIRIELAYDGAAYSGWQIQPRHATVQGELNSALSKLFKERIRSNGAGRTDAGAHALCYTANFRTSNRSLPAENLPRALNGVLPPDIRVLAAREVPGDFHAQFSAKAREYVYLVAEAASPLPHFRNYIHFPRETFDAGKLAECAKLFADKKDFAQFSYGYDPDEAVEPVRTVRWFRVATWRRFGMRGAAFTIRANGFLRGMIRTLVSVCLNYSVGKVTREEIEASFGGEPAIPSYRKAAAPACGLYFKRALY